MGSDSLDSTGKAKEKRKKMVNTYKKNDFPPQRYKRGFG